MNKKNVSTLGKIKGIKSSHTLAFFLSLIGFESFNWAPVRRWRDDSTATWGWWRHIFPGSSCFLRSPDWSGRKPPWNWWYFLVNVYKFANWKILENHHVYPCLTGKSPISMAMFPAKDKKTLAVNPPNPSVFHNGGLLLARMFVKFSSPYDVCFFFEIYCKLL